MAASSPSPQPPGPLAPQPCFTRQCLEPPGGSMVKSWVEGVGWGRSEKAWDLVPARALPGSLRRAPRSLSYVPSHAHLCIHVDFLGNASLVLWKILNCVPWCLKGCSMTYSEGSHGGKCSFRPLSRRAGTVPGPGICPHPLPAAAARRLPAGPYSLA